MGPRLETCAREREPDTSRSPAFAESTDSTALFVFAEGSASDVGVRIEVPEVRILVGLQGSTAAPHNLVHQPKTKEAAVPAVRRKGG